MMENSNLFEEECTGQQEGVNIQRIIGQLLPNAQTPTSTISSYSTLSEKPLNLDKFLNYSTVALISSYEELSLINRARFQIYFRQLFEKFSDMDFGEQHLQAIIPLLEFGGHLQWIEHKKIKQTFLKIHKKIDDQQLMTSLEVGFLKSYSDCWDYIEYYALTEDEAEGL